MKIVAVAFLVVSAFVAPAHAEDARDPSTALYLSIAGTAAGVVALVPTFDETRVAPTLPFFALATVLPSAGQFYAGNYVSPGLVARFLGISMIVVGFADPFESDEIISGEAQSLAVIGLGLTIGGTVYELVTARASAERYNARVRVVPVVATDHGVGPGVQLSGQF